MTENKISSLKPPYVPDEIEILDVSKIQELKKNLSVVAAKLSDRDNLDMGDFARIIRLLERYSPMGIDRGEHRSNLKKSLEEMFYLLDIINDKNGIQIQELMNMMSALVGVIRRRGTKWEGSKKKIRSKKLYFFDLEIRKVIEEIASLEYGLDREIKDASSVEYELYEDRTTEIYNFIIGISALVSTIRDKGMKLEESKRPKDIQIWSSKTLEEIEFLKHIFRPVRQILYPHPPFSRDVNSNPSMNLEDSVYYWWWQYLKRSESYIKTCENNGDGPCASIYVCFDDVRGDDFEEWWYKDLRGGILFGEPALIASSLDVKVIKKQKMAEVDSEELIVSIPLYLSKDLITERLSKILDKHHTGKRGKPKKVSKAWFKVISEPRISTLKKDLQVYDFKQANPDMPHWEVAAKLRGLSGKQKRGLNDPDADIRADVRKELTAIISRCLKRVEQSIKNTEKGMFP
jgi:hypothetical protein